MKTRAKKRYGQHFLEPAWADKLVAAIAPGPGDRFLEVGPGPGVLTLRLASKAAHVTAVEIDRAMIDTLEPKRPPNVTLLHADVLHVDLAELAGGQPLRVAGNLPYNISSPVLFALIEAFKQGASVTDATVMVQREVAERILAGPGGREYGVLSILIRLHADVRQVLVLPPGAFRPPPKVQSAVIQLRFRPPTVRVPDPPLFEAMVRSMFTQRRKTLANALRGFAGDRGTDPAAALSAAAIDPRRRPETLQLIELARLAESFPSR